MLNFNKIQIIFFIIYIYLALFDFSAYASNMGSLTLKNANLEKMNCSDSFTLSKTTLSSLATQERRITIPDVSGTFMIASFSNIITSTTLNESHSGIILVSGNTMVTLPDPSNVMGTTYTIKKIDSSSYTVTIIGAIDGNSITYLPNKYAYITIISDGFSWYKISESNEISENTYIIEDETTVSNALGMTFTLIQPGTFIMGSPIDENGRESDESQYTVTISKSYYIQTTEVTQGQWVSVMGTNPSYFSSCGLNCPVENVSWNDCITFISTLNAMGYGSYTLPTEAQWEYAARSGIPTALPNGNISGLQCNAEANLTEMGWYCGNSSSTSHPVGEKQANTWGLYDMHGNVWEWCLDFYDTYPTISTTDPIGPSSGTDRVRRGGGWSSYAEYCRSAKRFHSTPGNKGNAHGLRLIKIL